MKALSIILIALTGFLYNPTFAQEVVDSPYSKKKERKERKKKKKKSDTASSISDAYMISKEKEKTEITTTTPIQWEPIVEMDDRIYPSYVWATSICDYLTDNETPQPFGTYFGDSEGQIGMAFINESSTTAQVKLTIDAPEIMRKSELSCLALPNKVIEVFPEIDYRFDVLENNYQPRPVMIKYTLTVNGKEVYKTSKRITLMSIYQCPYIFRHRSGALLDQNFMFAAYVNENHPKISDEIIPEITDTKIVNKISGYLGFNNDAQQGLKEVFQQVFGMWEVLRSRNIKYSSITGFSSSNMVVEQHVRTVEQSLNTSHANCIDGTVLMASILYKMGIEPQIVLVPGHAYLGFYVQPKTGGERVAFYLETTMLDADVDESKLDASIIEVGNLMANDQILTNYRDSYIAFLGALQVGSMDYEKNASKFNKDDISYRKFEVDAYRKAKLLPLNH